MWWSVNVSPLPFGPGYAMLEEKDLPNDLVVIGEPYLGPPIVSQYDFLSGWTGM